MLAVLKEAEFAASNAQSVLILGETGTGKGLLARAIHKKSARRRRNFVRFQPSFGSSDLVSSELFGHERGAFTGATESRKGLLEEANGGTLFLDEVADLPLQTQVMLLEVLQEMQFRRVGSSRELQANLRLISATNKPIDKSIEAGELRSDFLHRIRHLQIEIVPLRERKEDIPALSQHFLDALVAHEDLSVDSLSDNAIGVLQSHSWPGNVRELQAVVENGVYRAAYAEKGQVGPEDLEILDSIKTSNITSDGSLREQVKAFEKKLAKQALETCGNNQSRAAQMLKIDRSSFRRILNRK
jgi:DNA-binding NtrC family response regulator